MKFSDNIKIITEYNNKTIIGKICSEIEVLAYNGQTHWSGVVFEHLSIIKKYFTNEGFTVTINKFHVLTISWE